MNKTNSFITRMLLFLGFLLAAANLYGQPQDTTKTTATAVSDTAYCPHEVSVWGAGGLSSLSYSPEFGDRSSKLGGAFGLGYTYFFHRDFGVLAGVELAFYGSSFKLNDLPSSSYRTVDIDDENTQNIDYKTQVKNYEERQSMMNINIPLMLQYRTDVFDGHKFYAGLGFKFGFPVSGKYEILKGSTLSASGDYYDSHKQELFEGRDLGYGDFNIRQKGDIGVRFSFMGAAEAGMKWNLNHPVLSLYTGLYFEYGFNDIVKTHSKQFYDNEKPTRGAHQVNTVLTSEHDGKSFTSRVSPMAFGLKVRLGVDICSLLVKEKPVKVEPVQEAPAPAPEIKEEIPAPPPAPVVEPESRRARARAILAARGDEEDEKPLVLPAPAPEPEVKASVKKIFERALQGIQFETGKDVIRPISFPILNEIVEAMNENPSYNLKISGHTDSDGKPESNWVLSENRANSVKFYLVGKGISESRLTTEGFGDTMPVVPNTTAANKAKNRRVEFVVKFEQEVFDK